MRQIEERKDESEIKKQIFIIHVKLWFTTMFYVGFIPWEKVL